MMSIRRQFDVRTRTRLRHWLRRTLRPAWLGTLRRTTPLSGCWGRDRGVPVDRVYIERFLHQHRNDIRGRTLEVKEPLYVRQFGIGVTSCDVLDNDARNHRATIVADISCAGSIPSDCFDCCVITQTLQYVYDLQGAARELHRILRPGGVLLVTVPVLSRLDFETEYPEYWRFTPEVCQRLFGAAFGSDRVTVQPYGNVLTGIAFLAGLAAEDLSRDEVNARDEYFPLVIGVRAVKAEHSS
jgi:SAM-dependent methyltransferase